MPTEMNLDKAIKILFEVRFHGRSLRTQKKRDANLFAIILLQDIRDKPTNPWAWVKRILERGTNQ